VQAEQEAAKRALDLYASKAGAFAGCDYLEMHLHF